MGAAYDVHPYVLLNFDNTLESVSTFMHEWGHAMHTLLANDAQPFEKADYSTFIAEIASTANEILLFDHLRKNSKNDQQKLYFLFKELSQIRGTFFRQTQFAEFELAIHKLIEKGEALSADKLDRIYGDILKQYYGHNEGIMNIKDTYTVEWAYIPHFYRNFYVYQYATSISAAYFLTDKILKKEKGSKETLIKILKAGGSNYPFDILLNAGVDMSSEAVYSSIISRMEQLMDEVELILNK
jgi:oligoendopeptidase F